MWIKEIIPITSLDDLEMFENQKRLIWTLYLNGKFPNGKETLNLLEEIINNEKKSFSEGEYISLLNYENISQNS